MKLAALIALAAILLAVVPQALADERGVLEQDLDGEAGFDYRPRQDVPTKDDPIKWTEEHRDSVGGNDVRE